MLPFLLMFAAALFAQGPARDRMVVVISLDGFPAFALDDAKLPVPTLRSLIQQGAMARRMTTVNPTVTWPNHTAMVTGVDASRHGVLANGTIVPNGSGFVRKVEPWIEKEKMVQATTVYDLAHRAGLTTAQVDWVAIHKAATITWAFPEVPEVRGTVEREMVSRGILTANDVEEFRKDVIVRRDQIWTQAAKHLIRTHKPNLLLFHVLSLDSGHHSYGPNTLGGKISMAFLDSCVKEIVDAVREAGMSQRTTFLIVSDHGFRQYTKVVHPEAVFETSELKGKAYVLPEGGSGYLYTSAENVEKAKKLMEDVEGIAKVVLPSEYGSMGLPNPGKNSQMSSLYLLAKQGYAIGGGTRGGAVEQLASPAGAHGYVASDPDMDAIFIASGYGIKKGAKLERVRNLDVAPTIAKLLGLTMTGIDGVPLNGVLE